MAARKVLLALVPLVLGGALLASVLVAPTARTATSVAAATTRASVARSAWPSGATTLSRAAWLKDLAELDRHVRATHPDPFVIHPESAWRAGLAALAAMDPDADRDRTKIALIRQVALLDTHSGVFPEEVGFHQYGLAVKEFADGVFVLGAKGGVPAGARLVAVGSMPIAEVLQRLEPLLDADNGSAVHDLRPWFVAQAEVLRSIGAVRDLAHPRFVFVLPDGSRRTVDVPVATLDDFGALWSAASARTPASWRATAADAVTARVEDRAVVISFTALDKDPTAAIATMRAALRSGRADRVVFDMRYCRGGDYTAADTMREALAAPPVRDRLTVITGSDNVSAASVLAGRLGRNTRARFVGAPTPTIANPMLDEITFTLPGSGVIVHIPRDRWVFDAADHRRAVLPEVPVRDRGASFFRGVDDTLPVALR